MKKYFLLFGIFCLSANLFAQNNSQPSAAAQMHNAMTQSLANTEYYDEAHKNVPNAHGVATKENLTGEAELLRQGIGAPFVNNKGGNFSQGADPSNVKTYLTHSTADPSNTIAMDSPVSIPPVSEPVSVSDDDIDAMMMNALGGEDAIKSSQDLGYQGNYETAVGQKEEQNFDMSAQIASASQKQAAATRAYEQQKQQAQQYNNSAGSKPAKSEPGFWGKLGAIALQGLTNTAIEATNYKYGTNIETIGNKNNSSGSSGGSSCKYGGYTLPAKACDLCVRNTPRSSYACNQCCRAIGIPLVQNPSYYPTSEGGRPSGCLCRFGPTSGLRFW